MIGFNSVYANVFDVEATDKCVKAHLSTSRKDQNDEYVNSNWFGYFVGRAKDKAENLSDRSRIFIISGAVVNEKFTDKNGDDKYFVAVKIFDFIVLDSDRGGGNKKSTKKTKKSEVDDDDDFLDDVEEDTPKRSSKSSGKSNTRKKKPKGDDDDFDDEVPF